MNHKIFSIIKRNSIILANSKLPSLILFLGPLFLIVLTGAVLQDTTLKNIQSSVYIEEQGEFTNSFLLGLEERDFRTQIESSLYECISKVSSGESQVCIEISRTYLGYFEQELYGYNIKLHVDFSQQRTVWGIIGSINGLAEQKSKEIRSEAIQKMKEEIGATNALLIAQKNKLNVLSSEINKADSYSNSLVSSVQKVEQDVNTVKIELIGLKNSAFSISNQFPLAAPLVSELNEDIDSLDNSLNEILFELNSASGVSGLSNNIENSIDLAKSRANEAELALIDAQNKISQIESLNFEGISEPLPVSYASINDNVGGSFGESYTQLDYLFPTFLSLFILFISLVFSTTLTIRERSVSAYTRNVTSGTKERTFVTGNFLTGLIIILIQVIIIFSISFMFLNINIMQNFFSLTILSLILGSIFIMIGTAIGYLFSSQENAIIGAISLALLLSVFLPLITPTETLPLTVGSLVKLSPLNIIENEFRLVSIFNSHISFSLSEYISLFFAFIIPLFITCVMYNRSREKQI